MMQRISSCRGRRLSSARRQAFLKYVVWRNIDALIIFRTGAVLTSYILQQVIISVFYALLFSDAAFLVYGPFYVRHHLHGHEVEFVCFLFTALCLLLLGSVSTLYCLRCLHSSSNNNSGPATVLHRFKPLPGNSHSDDSCADAKKNGGSVSVLLSDSPRSAKGGARSILDRIAGHDAANGGGGVNNGEIMTADEVASDKVVDDDESGSFGVIRGWRCNDDDAAEELLEEEERQASTTPRPSTFRLAVMRLLTGALPALPAWAAPGAVSTGYVLLLHSLPPSPRVVLNSGPWLFFGMYMGTCILTVFAVNSTVLRWRALKQQNEITFSEVLSDTLLFQLAFALAMAADLLLEHVAGHYFNKETRVAYRMLALCGLFTTAILLRTHWLDADKAPRLCQDPFVLAKRFLAWSLSFVSCWSIRDFIVDLWQLAASVDTRWSPVTAAALTAVIGTLLFGGLNVSLGVMENLFPRHFRPGLKRTRLIRLSDQIVGSLQGWSWALLMDTCLTSLRSRIALHASSSYPCSSGAGGASHNVACPYSPWGWRIFPGTLLPIITCLATFLLIAVVVAFFTQQQSRRMSAIRSREVTGPSQLATAALNEGHWADYAIGPDKAAHLHGTACGHH